MTIAASSGMGTNGLPVAISATDQAGALAVSAGGGTPNLLTLLVNNRALGNEYNAFIEFDDGGTPRVIERIIPAESLVCCILDGFPNPTGQTINIWAEAASIVDTVPQLAFFGRIEDQVVPTSLASAAGSGQTTGQPILLTATDEAGAQTINAGGAGDLLDVTVENASTSAHSVSLVFDNGSETFVMSETIPALGSLKILDTYPCPSGMTVQIFTDTDGAASAALLAHAVVTTQT